MLAQHTWTPSCDSLHQPGPCPYPTMHLNTASTVQLVGIPLCPDLLRYDQLGGADNWRGRVVRGFFWLLRCWPTSK
jgi:hypothetical protein